MNLSKRDQKVLWHPFTQQQTADFPIAIKKANGSYIYDYNNCKYFLIMRIPDLVSIVVQITIKYQKKKNRFFLTL